MSQNVYSFNVKKIDGSQASLNDYKGQVMLVVNVASKCGLTPQYDGLEKLHENYHSKGLAVLGFPANEFLAQEPGTNAEIQEFCRMNYGIKFPMFEKIVVKGDGQHPLYAFLTETKPNATMKPDGTLIERLKSKGLLSGKDNDIKWNFEKFLINRKGEVVDRFSPELDPQDPIIVKAVERELAAL
ncbi:glutathione peroxidase [Peredibacter starrii]|uniref:Glutathione peroxidase n=1 Tax=Peredibacter starrii TaxID=28202 RepID=A0AAX4HQU7_9BACT|nr:glutathione peroxidase [Peredibacter starrii]WPU65704.1 glutathione peroxidase [Peredibacter starrii]